MESFFQESGRAGRGGSPAKSTLCVNNDIGANVEGMQLIMREYHKYPENWCRRKIVLNHIGFGIPCLVISHFGYLKMECSNSKSLGMFAQIFLVVLIQIIWSDI